MEEIEGPMTALSTFCFLGYRLRPAVPADLPLAAEWNAKDPDHARKVEPQFWVAQGKVADAYLLVDYEKDGPLFFLKLCAWPGGAVELHIQFDPEVGRAARLRRQTALTEGFEWLERTLKVSGVKEIFFRSRNSGLILFSVKRLGFITDPVTSDGETTLRKLLAPPPQVNGHF